MRVWVMAISHCIPPVSRGMNCPSHQRSPLISLVGCTRREGPRWRSGRWRYITAWRKRKTLPLSAAGIAQSCGWFHVPFIWCGFEVSDETVTLCDCTPWQACASNCSRNQNNLLSPANTFFCRCVKFQIKRPCAPTSTTLDCRCINMARKQIMCDLWWGAGRGFLRGV